MVLTNPEGSEVLAYIINDVFQLDDDDSLALALETKSCKDIYDLILMSDDDISSLTYANANKDMVKLQGALKNKIRIFQQYIMYRYCLNEPIGNDWESITAENFDTYRTITYLIDTPIQQNTEMKTILLLALIAYDISNDCKREVSQDEVSSSATLSNVPSIDNELTASDNHPPLESTHLNSRQYCNIDTLVSASPCLEMGSIQIESFNKVVSKQIDLEKAALCTDKEIGFIINKTESCQVIDLKDMIDFPVGNDKMLMSSILNGTMDLLQDKVSGMIEVKELVNDVVVLELMLDPMVGPQLVIDRGRVNSIQADGE